MTSPDLVGLDLVGLDLVGFDLVGFGEAMVLIAPTNGVPLESAHTVGLHVAGAELNVCAAAASLGLRTAFASRVGADPLGRRVQAATARLAISPDLIRVDRHRPTGVFFKDVQPDGERRVYYYRTGSAASTMDEVDAERVLAARPALVVVSGITAALGAGPRAAVRTLARLGRAAGVRIALDPNLRPALGPVTDQAVALLELLPLVDILILGADEAGHLFGVDDPTEVFAAARLAGVGETVLKAGAEGCYVEDGDRARHQPSAATDVVDPVGAGDAFAGGYLAGRYRGLSPARSAWLGTELAARVITTAGDTDGLPDPVVGAALLAAAAGGAASPGWL